MSNTVVAAPFGKKVKLEPIRRKGGRNAEPGADDISRGDLEKYLMGLAEGKEADVKKLEDKFNNFITEGNSFGYLADGKIRALFAQYLGKQLAGNPAEAIAKFMGPGSVFEDYMDKSRLSFKHDSIERQLYDYSLIALERKQNGEDPISKPVSLTEQGLEGFIDHLTDPVKGLSTKAEKLDKLRISANPLLRILRDVALNKLGLRHSIESTRKQLMEGQSSELTEKLGGNIKELLKREEEQLARLLPSDGGLIVEQSKGRTRKIDKLVVKSSFIESLGAEEKKLFDENKELDFGEFFRTAHKLALEGENSAEQLAAHVGRGMAVIIACHKAQLAEAEKGSDKVAQKQKINEEFGLISRAIQGKGLVPKRIAKVVREAASLAILSKDFRDIASAGDVGSRDKQLIQGIFAELSGGNREATALSGVKDLVKGNKIQIISEDGSTVEHALAHIENSEFRTPDLIEANRELKSGASVSLERVKQEYERTVGATCDKVYTSLAKVITDKGSGFVAKKTIDELAQGTETAISEVSKLDESGTVTLISQQLTSYIGKGAQSRNKDQITKSLETFALEIMGKTRLSDKDRASLIKTLETSIAGLLGSILKGENTTTTTTAFLTAIKNQMPGDNESDKKSNLETNLADDKAKDHLRTLLNSLRVKAEDTEDLTRVIKLDDIFQIFEGSEGKRLQRSLEALSHPGTKYSDVKESPESEQFGEFATLLLAKDDQGIDESRRLTALAQLILHAAGGDDSLRKSLCQHVISKLKGSSITKQADETMYAARLNKALITDITAPSADRIARAEADLLSMEQAFQMAYVEGMEDTKSKELKELEKEMQQSSTSDDRKAEIKADIKARYTEVTKGVCDAMEADIEAKRKWIEALKDRPSAPITLTDWIKDTVMISQQRFILLRDTFLNARRDLDGVRSHFSAVGLRYFGDKQIYDKQLKAAAEDIASASESTDKDSMNARELFEKSEGIKSNSFASTMFSQLYDGIKTQALELRGSSAEHPGDIIERIAEFLQNTIYNPVLAAWRMVKPATAPAESAPRQATQLA